MRILKPSKLEWLLDIIITITGAALIIGGSLSPWWSVVIVLMLTVDLTRWYAA